MERECVTYRNIKESWTTLADIRMIQITRSGLIITRYPLLTQYTRIIQQHGMERFFHRPHTKRLAARLGQDLELIYIHILKKHAHVYVRHHLKK